MYFGQFHVVGDNFQGDRSIDSVTVGIECSRQGFVGIAVIGRRPEQLETSALWRSRQGSSTLAHWR